MKPSNTIIFCYPSCAASETLIYFFPNEFEAGCSSARCRPYLLGKNGFIPLTPTWLLWPWHSLRLEHPHLAPSFVDPHVFFFPLWGISVSVIWAVCRRENGFHGNTFQTATVCALGCFLSLILRLHFCERHWSLQHIVRMHTNHPSSSQY